VEWIPRKLLCFSLMKKNKNKETSATKCSEARHRKLTATCGCHEATSSTRRRQKSLGEKPDSALSDASAAQQRVEERRSSPRQRRRAQALPHLERIPPWHCPPPSEGNNNYRQHSKLLIFFFPPHLLATVCFEYNNYFTIEKAHSVRRRNQE